MKGNTVTRAHLAEAVYQEVGLSRNESAELVDSVLNEISDALAKGDWDAMAAALATEWENRKRLAPGVTTPAIDALIARMTAAGPPEVAASLCRCQPRTCSFGT